MSEQKGKKTYDSKETNCKYLCSSAEDYVSDCHLKLVSPIIVDAVPLRIQ